jgi:PST family polysaccharide transporter
MRVSPFLWSVANGVATRALTFVFFIAISRLIAPADFGVMALALALALLIDTLIEQGLGDALVQRHELGRDDAGSVFIYQVTMAVAIAALLRAGAPFIASVFGEPRLAGVLPWIGLGSVFNSLGFVRQALYRRELQFKVLAIRNFTATCFGGLLGFWYAYHGAGVMSLVAMHVGNAALGACVLWIATKPPFAFQFHAARLRDLLVFSRHILGTRIIEVVSGRLDQVLIGQYFGVSVLGYYALAVRLYETLLQTTAVPVVEVAYPLFSKLQNDRTSLGQSYLRIIEYGGAFTIPLFVGAAVTAPIFIPALFGSQWQPAIGYVVMILAVGALNSIDTYNDVLFGAVNRPDLRLKFAVASVVLWVLCAFALFPMGVIYVAITWCIRALVMYPVRLKRALSFIDVNAKQYLKIVVPELAACLAMVTVILAIRFLELGFTAIILLFIQVAVGAVTYFIALHVAGSPLPGRLARLRRF